MNHDTLFLRQVHPDWVQRDSVSPDVFVATSQTFNPTPKDKDKLSLYDSSVFTAEQSHEHFTSQNFKSKGVLGVTHGEFVSQNLPCERDDKPFVGHVSADYSSCTSKGERARKAKILKGIAMKRGWQYLNNE